MPVLIFQNNGARAIAVYITIYKLSRSYLESKYYAMVANNFYQLNSSHIDLFHGDKH